MTTPDEEPLTQFDPGRGQAAGTPDDGAQTEVDPGRSRLDDEPRTESDPGRGPAASNWLLSLPPGLASRFEMVRELTGNGQQADIFLVNDRETGESRVLKVYRRGWQVDVRVLDYLSQSRVSRHIVRVLETGEEDGRQYEIMEYLAGGNLFEWRIRAGKGFDEETLTEVVRQVAEALAELHEAGIVHRDLKPANLLIRRLEPLDVVVADIGISRYLDDQETFTDNRDVGTLNYLPPEYLGGGQIHPALDWWSLGISALELSRGQVMFPGADSQVVRAHITSRPIGLGELGDGRIRLLCGGLLVRNPDDRWGADQVQAWLRGESPAVATDFPQRTDQVETAKEPFTYSGAQYWSRDLLAIAMTGKWETSRDFLFGDNPGRQRELAKWLRQFPSYEEPTARARRRASRDVQLLHQLRAINPAHPPVYRGYNITTQRLPELANEGIGRTGNGPDVINDLWQEDLLPLLSKGSASPGLGGGDGLDVVRLRWREEETRLRDLSRSWGDEEPRTELQRLLRDDPRFGYALSLMAATATQELQLAVRRTLDECDQESKLLWFSALVARPECQWVAFVLVPYAKAAADRRNNEEEARRVREEWMRRNQWRIEWSNRQNRPLALAYAAAGVFTVGVGLFVLIGLGDMIGMVSNAVVLDAWFGTVAALLVTLVAESLLAWEIGGRYHPAYSLLGAGRLGARGIAQALLRTRTSMPVVIGLLAALGALTVFFPVVTPFVVAAFVIVWAVQRHVAWTEDRSREQEIVNRPGTPDPSLPAD
jgi:eukaryotic-like serine/threonine-protein kinase